MQLIEGRARDHPANLGKGAIRADAARCSSQPEPDSATGSLDRLRERGRLHLAKTLLAGGNVLLLDEPLSALDANLRRQMQTELKSLQREVGITFIFVTHDQEEAMALSDRVALLRAGHLEQIAGPREIYGEPATAYAAEFIGQTNLLRADVRDGVVMVTDGPFLEA